MIHVSLISIVRKKNHGTSKLISGILDSFLRVVNFHPDRTRNPRGAKGLVAAKQIFVELKIGTQKCTQQYN